MTFFAIFSTSYTMPFFCLFNNPFLAYFRHAILFNFCIVSTLYSITFFSCYTLYGFLWHLEKTVLCPHFQTSSKICILLPQNHCHSSTIKRPEPIAKALTRVTTRKGESKINTSLDKTKSMFLTIDDHLDWRRQLPIAFLNS